jgi:uncharacterized protein YecE (DUF72 family)
MVIGWNRRLPDGFHVVAKGSRRITHLQRLAGVEADLERFLARIEGVRALKVLLWQLPPSFRFDYVRPFGLRDRGGPGPNPRAAPDQNVRRYDAFTSLPGSGTSSFRGETWFLASSSVRFEPRRMKSWIRRFDTSR